MTLDADSSPAGQELATPNIFYLSDLNMYKKR
jgi:hypothetical protein